MPCGGHRTAEEAGAAGLHVTSSEAVQLPFGPSWRVTFTFDSMQPDVTIAGETWTLSGQGMSYQPYFETTASLHDQHAPIFEAIMRSFREREPSLEPSPRPGQPSARYPHDAPRLEAQMPTTALDRPLCIWSMAGQGAAMGDPLPLLVLEELSLSERALTVAIAGRASASLDPPYIVSAWQFSGASPDAIAALFEDWPNEDLLEVAGLDVYRFYPEDTPGHAEGEGYMVLWEDRIYGIQTAEVEWMEDVVTQIAALIGD